MKWLPDPVVERLRAGAATPVFTDSRYRVVRFLARGGMGAVWLAEDTALGRPVALKVLEPDAGTEAELSARLVREARVLARLEHPGIVPVHDVGMLADGRPFYTMKFIEGRRLDEHLAGLPALPDRLRLFTKVCEAVAFANARGVVHRDIKPANIMVGPFGEVLVMDWGVAKILGETAAGRAASPPRSDGVETSPGAVIGTPGYMAPEQARGEGESADGRADVFSLGMLLRHMGSGSEGRALPRPLEAVVARATATSASDRYGDAGALALEVARFLDGLPPHVFPDNWLRKSRRFIARHRVWILLVLAYLLMRALLIFWPRG